MSTYKVIPQGGIRFAIYGEDGFIRSTEFGGLDDEGQYIEDDDEIAEHVRGLLGLDDDDDVIIK